MLTSLSDMLVARQNTPTITYTLRMERLSMGLSKSLKAPHRIRCLMLFRQLLVHLLTRSPSVFGKVMHTFFFPFGSWWQFYTYWEFSISIFLYSGISFLPPCTLSSLRILSGCNSWTSAYIWKRRREAIVMKKLCLNCKVGSSMFCA